MSYFESSLKQNINVNGISCHQQYRQITLPMRGYNDLHMSQYNLILRVLFSELGDSNDNEEPDQAMDDELPVDPEPELELRETNSGRFLSN